MSGWVILLAIAIILTIIFLTGRNPFKKKSRAEYLEELREFVEGTLEELPGYESSFLVKFQFEGRNFEFEDIETEGFKETTHKAFLKIQTESDLELTFIEQAQSGAKYKIVKASEIDSAARINKVHVPQQLADFDIHTNHVKEVNIMFDDYEIVDTFAKYKNFDTRGYPIMSLRIHVGMVVIEFFPSVTMKPSLFNLQHSVTSIDEYLVDLTRIAIAINDIKTKKEE